MIQITVFSLLAIGASCLSLGFALCNVLYLVFSTSDGRAGRGKKVGDMNGPDKSHTPEKKRRSRFGEWLESKPHPIACFFIAMAVGFVTSLIREVL